MKKLLYLFLFTAFYSYSQQTISNTFNIPDGYKRLQNTGYANWIISQPIKTKEKVFYYDGNIKTGLNTIYIAKFDYDIGKRDLHHCADAAIYLRANYNYSNGFIDRLKFTFTNGYVTAPMCGPARAGFMTGRYQQRTGIEGVVTAKGPARKTGLPLSEVTFAEALKGGGYATGMFGKWHVGYREKFNPVRQGFDEFIGYVSGNVDYHSHVDQAGFEDWWKGDKKVSAHVAEPHCVM